MKNQKYTAFPITFTFNGMLKTNEIAGEGNSFSTEFRQYDPRLGKWLSLDPLMEQFPWMSPFVGFDNNPILYVDPYGLSSQDGRKGQEEDDKKKQEEPKEEKKRSPDGITEGGEFPTNPNLGDIHGDDNNKFYKFKNDGWNEIQSAKVDNSKSKEKKNDSYKGFKGVSLGGFWGALNEGKSRIRDNIAEQSAYTQERWEYYRTQGETLDKAAAIMLTAPVAIVTAVETSPYWAPHVWNLAKGYNYTFGMNGGYENMVYNYGYQSMSTGNLGIGNKDLIGLGLSAFTLRSTPVLTQAIYGASGGLVQYSTNKGLQTFQGSGGYIVGSMVNGGLTPILSNSRFGNNLSSNFIFGTSQMFLNIMENKQNWNK